MELTHDAYTVGWVCALPKEQTAATAMLDEIHASLPKPANDHNAYTLGAIGKHNVAITCLPKGTIGTNSAANVATCMVNTFTSIKFGLLVGIGGGVPPKIRLGDVVVSTPVDTYPGVVQWDLGKAEDDGHFKRTGALSNPPRVLLTALTKLETQHEMVGSRIPEYLDELKQKWPKLGPKYLRSDSMEDVLFRADYGHVRKSTAIAVYDEEEEEEDNCQLCDKTKTVRRKPRDMRVHYGLVASGNQVIKATALRDRVNKELGGHVLCVEMEAAGIMGHFPGIVIRGICDYADSHKNDAWQEHAAAVAAAFAKELLSHVQPSDVEGERTAKDILNQVRDTVVKTGADVAEIKSMMDGEEDQKILNWLTPIDYGPQQCDFIGRRQEGTGAWLLTTKEFSMWLHQRKTTLFCSGIPGAGKTILTSIVVDYLNSKFRADHDVGISYLYLNFRQQQQQQPEDLLRSILKQLLQRRAAMPENIKELLKLHGREQTRPSLGEISQMLYSVAALYSRIYIIIDALDECDDSNGNCQKFLSTILNLQQKTGANLFVTSRINERVARFFTTALSLDIIANTDDLKNYIDSQMTLLPSDILDEDIRDSIRRGVFKAASGMFLLAQLHMNNLRGQPTKGDIKQVLQNLAKGVEGLSETYTQAMERINDQGRRSRDLAKSILGWITHAKRPLSTVELRHALAVRPGEAQFDQEYLPNNLLIHSICAGLVTTDERSGIIRLVHYTAQQYFEQSWREWFPNIHIDIADVCITYLSYDDFALGICHSDQEFEKRLQTYALYDYAAKNWAYHASNSRENMDRILNFLRCRDKVSAASQAMRASPGYRDGYSQRTPKKMTGIHIAAFFGLHWVKDLLENSVDSGDGDYGRTPLSWAAGNGHEAMVKLLLDTGKVDVNSKDEYYGQTPLSWAAKNGHEAVVKLLLDTGKVDVNLEDEGRRTPLLWAAANGHEAVVKLLLDTGRVDINSMDENGETPLLWAAQSGYEAVVKLLLDTGRVDINLMDEGGQTPLLWAVESGHEAVVKLLLDTGKVDINSTDGDGRTPLLWAARSGHEAVVKLLLNTGKVDINSTYEDGQTPLLWAAKYGYEAVVKLLLETGKVDINSTDEDGQTPLLWAARNGHEAVVSLLLNTGKVDVNSKDKDYGRTPLLWAAENGREAVVKLLLNTGKVSVDSKDKYGRTPLSLAVKKRNEAVVKVLLETGRVNVDLKDDDYERTPLSWAVANGHEAMVKLLLNTAMVNVNSEDNDGQTPLSWAAKNGHDVVVKLLLDTEKVYVNSRDNYRETPLSKAAEKGHEAVVKLLLDTGKVDIDSEGSSRRTPLSWAAENGYEAVVKLLLDTGKAIIDSTDEFKRTPMSWAAQNGHEAVVKLLLDTGKVNVDLKDKYGWTPLSLAAKNGHDTVARLLLNIEWVDIDSRDDSYGRTPLSWAALYGHEAVVKLLLDTGKADVNSKDDLGSTPLLWVTQNGHKGVVKQLIDTGKVDINSIDEDGRTSLSWVAAKGYEAMAKLLLDTGKADLDSKDIKYGRTPMSWAAGNGHEAVIKLLLNTTKASVDLKDIKYGQTPLSRAAKNGHDMVVKLLLDTGKAIADSKDKYGCTPLLWAAKNGHEAVVKLLLDTGKVDVDSKDAKFGYTPLAWAARNGHEAVVKQLQSYGTASQ